jgi:hypothetical protein
MKRLFLFAVLFLALSASATAYSISRHEIEVSISNDGSATVTEKYFMDFLSVNDLRDFQARALQLGASLEAWQAFEKRIFAHIGGVKGGTGRVSLEQKDEEHFIKLEYDSSEPLATVSSETSRKTDWLLNSNAFQSFQVGSVYVIPTTTKITISVPKEARLDVESIKPEGIVLGNSVAWNGYLYVSGNLVIKYSLEKQIAPAIGISKMMQEIVSSSLAPLFAAAVLVLAGLVYWKRKAIAKKIEAFVVNNSSIEGKEEEEFEIE